jgi:hypothetical protein
VGVFELQAGSLCESTLGKHNNLKVAIMVFQALPCTIACSVTRHVSVTGRNKACWVALQVKQDNCIRVFSRKIFNGVQKTAPLLVGRAGRDSH